MSEIKPLQVDLGSPLAHPKEAPVAAQAELAPAKQAIPKVGVFICHGMGQQVPFETLDSVAKGLLAWAGTHGGAHNPLVRLLRFEGKLHARAEVLVGPSEQQNEVHLYEAYWAPLTEGKVDGWDVIKFLVDAGWKGFWYSDKRGFYRWMFGGRKHFTVAGKDVLYFAVGLATLASLLLLYATIWLSVIAYLLQALRFQWPSPALVSDLRVNFVLLILRAAVVLVLFLLLPVLIRKAAPGRSAGGVTNRILQLIIYIGVVLAFLLIISAALGALFAGIYHASGWWKDEASTSIFTPIFRVVSTILGPFVPVVCRNLVMQFVATLILIGAAFVVRYYVVEYVGDVAAYVSSHKVSKFAELRQSIQETALTIAKAIYSNQEYEKVIVVGHSLGSVVAYDTLNRIINEDSLSNNGMSVLQRTRLLLTLGSPLDKTAFVFRMQLKNAVVREAAAGAKQPLIVDYRNRPFPWVNIYSRQDWISGALDYYDDPELSHSDPKRVQNVEDRFSFIPLAAHTEYWDHSAFQEQLFRAIMQQ